MRKYFFPISAKLGTIVLITVSLALLYLLRNNHQPGKIIFNIVFSGLAIYWMIELYKSFTTYTTNEVNIIVKYLFLPEKKIRFCDISMIADKNVASKLILRNIYGKRLLTIDKTLKNYEGLKEEIKNKKSETPVNHIKSAFRIANSVIGGLAGGVILFGGPIVFSLINKDYQLAAISLLVAGYFLFIFRKIILSVQLSFSSIIIKYPYHSRILYFIDVKNVYQETNSKSKDRITTYTIIETNDGEKISLSKFNPDDELLFESCKYYYENRATTT